MSTWIEDIVAAFEELGGSAKYEELYSRIAARRTNLTSSWKAGVRRQIQDKSSDSQGYTGGDDLFFSVEGLGSGVWGLRSYLSKSPKAVDLPMGVEEPSRIRTETYRILRDTVLARKIKVLHGDRCQLCNQVVSLGKGRTYSEAHHIIPLGSPHYGPDEPSNIIVLCPTHHVLCDYGAIPLDLHSIRILKGHAISQLSVQYHNKNIHMDDHLQISQSE